MSLAPETGKAKYIVFQLISKTPANLTEQPLELITLSLDENNNEAFQGNFIPPLVENVFNIDISIILASHMKT